VVPRESPWNGHAGSTNQDHPTSGFAVAGEVMVRQRVRVGGLVGAVMVGMAAPGQPTPPSQARHIGCSPARSR
jgi:hypothetical protein